MIKLPRRNAIGGGTPCQQQLYYIDILFVQQPSHSQGRPDIIQPVDTPRRGLLPPYMGGGYVWPAYDERQHPIPDFPPYDVRPPHMHGAPTTDDTSHGDTDAKQRAIRALIMCLQQLPETMLRKENS